MLSANPQQPQNKTARQSTCHDNSERKPLPCLTVTIDPTDHFANIVITNLPNPQDYIEDIEEILHRIRHFGAHGDSSGRRSSLRKAKSGETLENSKFRLAITHYCLPRKMEQLSIQIHRNTGSKDLILDGTPAQDDLPIQQTSQTQEESRYAKFIASAPDELTAQFRRRIIALEHDSCKKQKSVKSDDAQVGRAMTASEVDYYFSYLLNMCCEHIARYLEQIFQSEVSIITITSDPETQLS